VHAIDDDLDRRLGGSGTSEDRVDRLDVLARLGRGRSDDRLCKQLAAEDDARTGLGVAGPITVLAVGFERDRLQQVLDGEHGAKLRRF